MMPKQMKILKLCINSFYSQVWFLSKEMFKNIVHICKLYTCKAFIPFMVISEPNHDLNPSRNTCSFPCNDPKFSRMLPTCIIINETIDTCFSTCQVILDR